MTTYIFGRVAQSQSHLQQPQAGYTMQTKAKSSLTGLVLTSAPNRIEPVFRTSPNRLTVQNYRSQTGFMSGLRSGTLLSLPTSRDHAYGPPSRQGSSATRSTQTPTASSSPEWLNAFVFGLGGIAVFGLIVMLFGIYVLDRWIEQKLIVDSVLLVGASTILVVGTVWIISAIMIIWIMFRNWHRSRS